MTQTRTFGWARWLLRLVGGLALSLTLGSSIHAQNLCASKASLINPELSRTASNEGGIGGTGMMAARPGLGGTGISEGGIGGTGVTAGRPGLGGTGIVGVITGFASICVNGLEVQFDTATPVSDNGQSASSRELAVGQVVAVRAAGVGSELTANSISVIHAAVGPVDALNPGTGEFRILGQTAWTSDFAALAGVQQGSWVRVSGHRLAQGDIVASRIEPIAPQERAQLSGTVSKRRGGTIEVDGTLVRFDTPQMGEGMTVGREVVVSGTWFGGALQAQRVQADLTRGGLAEVKDVVLEGFVRSVSNSQIDIGRGPLTLSSDVQIVGGSAGQLKVNERVQINGRVDADQRLKIERIEFRSGSMTSRQRALMNSRRSSDDSDASSGKTRSERSGSSDDSGSSGSSSGSGSGGSDSSGSGSSGSGSSGSGSSGSSGSGSGGSSKSGSSDRSGRSGRSSGSGGGHD